MDLADCGSPTRLLEVIFRYYPELPRRVPVKEIAAEVGVKDFRVLEVDGFIGGLIADPEKSEGIILVKDKLPPKRERFTVGHELGHFLIPSHGYQRQCSKKDLEENSRTTTYQRQETEANKFSAGLLMPKSMFVKDIDALGSADVSHARELSDQYNVSMEAVANRYVELTADMCAYIFSHDGIVRYARPSKEFPRLTVAKGSPLPHDCLTRRYNAASPSAWGDFGGSVWLEAERGKRMPRVLEQAIAQANGFKITLLYIESSEIEESDEEREFDNNWTLRFR